MSLPDLSTLPELIDDDATCTRIALALGLLDEMLQESALSNAVFRTEYDHASHWILLIRFHGLSDATENGWLVRTWAKADWPRSVLNAEVAHLERKFSLEKVSEVKPPKGPAQN